MQRHAAIRARLRDRVAHSPRAAEPRALLLRRHDLETRPGVVARRIRRRRQPSAGGRRARGHIAHSAVRVRVRAGRAVRAGEIVERIRERDVRRRGDEPQARVDAEVRADVVIVRLDHEHVRPRNEERIRRADRVFGDARHGRRIVSRLRHIHEMLRRPAVRARHLHAVDERDEAIVHLDLQDQRSRERRLRGRHGESLPQIKRRRLVQHRRLQIRVHRRAPARRQIAARPRRLVEARRIPRNPRAEPRSAVRAPLEIAVARRAGDFIDDNLRTRAREQESEQEGDANTDHILGMRLGGVTAMGIDARNMA